MSRVALACLLLALAGTPHAAPVRVIDDAGQTLELPSAPQRIVSLAPHLTELLFAVGAGEQIVGVDSQSDFPLDARQLPRVGDHGRVSLERILGLAPDLIVVWAGGNRAVDIHALKSLGLPVLQTRATRLDDVARLLKLVGLASGKAQAGEAAAQDFRARLASMRASDGDGGPVSVFYQVWNRPLMTVGGAHWITDALSLCGARNVFADLKVLAPIVSREAVLQRQPALIVSSDDGPALQDEWARFGGLSAVKNRAFIQLDADLLHRPSPRIIQGVANLCAAIAPYR